MSLPDAPRGRARSVPPGFANEKEYLNEVLTRRKVLNEIRGYHRRHVAPVHQWIEYKSQPLWTRAWQQIGSWWHREWTWPPQEPGWWPESLSWGEGEAS